MTNEYLPFGGPRLRRSRNTKRRITWRNYSFAYTNVWQLFDERREVWLGPGPISEIRAMRQRLYEHRYLIAEASDLGDTEAQKLMTLARDAYTQIVDCGNGSFKLHIIPDPAIAHVNAALEAAGVYDQQAKPKLTAEQEEKIAEIKKQLDRA